MENSSPIKIIFWIDSSLIDFALSYYLDKKINYELYAIIDITNKPKNFFETQNLVKFKKFWFYHDNIKQNYVADRKFLEKFEKSNNLNLLELISNDRHFNKFNEFHQFSDEQILSIVEQECIFFDKILTEVKPMFMVTQETALRSHHLLYLLSKSKKIKILMLNYANFGKLCYISENHHKIDFEGNLDNVEGKNLGFEELQAKRKSINLSKTLVNFNKIQAGSMKEKLKAGISFLNSKNSNIKTHYTYFGRTKFNVLFSEIKEILRKKSRENFVNKYLKKKVNYDCSYLFFPLHQEPERSLLIACPYYTNQIETIRHIVKSMPIGYKLLVKEHPTQGPARGWRDVSFYKEIMQIPNVDLIHPSVSNDKLIQNCSLVISAGGTSSFEATFFQKPSIIFADVGYSILPSVFKVNSFHELPTIISIALKTEVDNSDLDRYVTLLENNSFTLDYLKLLTLFNDKFFFGGHSVDVEISPLQMKLFLDLNNNMFTTITDQFIKKINNYLETESKITKSQKTD